MNLTEHGFDLLLQAGRVSALKRSSTGKPVTGGSQYVKKGPRQCGCGSRGRHRMGCPHAADSHTAKKLRTAAADQDHTTPWPPATPRVMSGTPPPALLPHHTFMMRPHSPPTGRVSPPPPTMPTMGPPAFGVPPSMTMPMTMTMTMPMTSASFPLAPPHGTPPPMANGAFVAPSTSLLTLPRAAGGSPETTTRALPAAVTLPAPAFPLVAATTSTPPPLPTTTLPYPHAHFPLYTTMATPPPGAYPAGAMYPTWTPPAPHALPAAPAARPPVSLPVAPPPPAADVPTTVCAAPEAPPCMCGKHRSEKEELRRFNDDVLVEFERHVGRPLDAAGQSRCWSRRELAGMVSRNGGAALSTRVKRNRKELKRIPLDEGWDVEAVRRCLRSPVKCCHKHCAQAVRLLISVARGGFMEWPLYAAAQRVTK